MHIETPHYFACLLVVSYCFFLGCDKAPTPESSPATEEEHGAQLVVSTGEPAVTTTVVAWVNDVPIAHTEVDRRLEHLERLYRHSRRPFGPDVRKQKREQVIERLIDRELIEQHVKESGITIPSTRIDAELSHRVESVFGTTEALNLYLREQDMTPFEFRRRIEMELAIEELLEAGKLREETTEEEVRELYERIASRRMARERVEASSILVRTPPGATNAVKERLVTATNQRLAGIKSRDDFAQMAKKVSQGPTARKGGYLGWIERGAAGPHLEPALFAAKTGTMSEPMLTSTGYEVFWIHQRRPAGIRGFDEVEDVIRERAQQSKIDARRQSMIQELREKAQIRYPGESTP